MIENKSQKVTVIIDAFRAFATACYVLERNPQQYIYATKSSVLEKLSLNLSNTLFIGKNEIGENIKYDIPNSPTRVTEVEITNKIIMHRTEAGSKGVLAASNYDIILVSSFVNAGATAQYIKQLNNPIIKIVPMGHEANTPSIEDNICAEYIQSLINSKNF